MEMNYLRGACGVRWEGESNEGMYERCGMVSLVAKVSLV